MTTRKKLKKVCLVVSAPMTINAFLGQPLCRLSSDFELYVIMNGEQSSLSPEIQNIVTVLTVCIERNVSPFKDLSALCQMISLFRLHNFAIVHSITPKAGLLAMMAAFLAGVNVRLHTFTGQVWVTRTGLTRVLLKSIDRLIAGLTSYALVDSPSQRQYLLDEGVLSEAHSGVLAQGSISGVNTARFKPDIEARNRIRKNCGIDEESVVILFLGRLNRDKGLLDLATAFAALNEAQSYLLVVGPDEGGLEFMMAELMQGCRDRVRFINFTPKPEEYIAAADVFCLPSYREGFGSVIIEAAAVGIPSIGSRIYGITDAIVDGETGLLFQAHNVEELRKAMERLVKDRDFRVRLGEKSRQRATTDFASESVADAWLEFYKSK